MSGRGQGPLAGVRVLDLTSVLMGPYATQIFADLGADVIKVESPEGDSTRYLPPGPAPDRGGMFMNLNRGKRSLVLDLKNPAAREAVLRMARNADVFIHSMRAQAIGRLGLDYAAVRPVNPRIIYANLYGFGRGGPYADYPAYDDIVQAASGIASLQAKLNPTGEPSYLATVVADKVSGMTAAYAVMAALYAREKTGKGQEVEVPMFETIVAFAMTEHIAGAIHEPAVGIPEYPRVVAAERRPYRTADGYVGALVYSDKQWRAFFKAIGDPEWSKDPMFASMRSRTENIRAVLSRLAEVMLTRTTEEWLALFREVHIPAMPVNSTVDLLSDPHLEAVGFWRRSDTEDGRIRMTGVPTGFSETPGAVGDPGPALGADSDAVLAEAGFSAEEIENLRASGAVR
jgi:crotonobetainyl-CoA:carnitine CoA-transferase CaiB-like acyl-CoA transferase